MEMQLMERGWKCIGWIQLALYTFGLGVGFCKHRYGPMGSVECREFIYWLTGHQFPSRILHYQVSYVKTACLKKKTVLSEVNTRNHNTGINITGRQKLQQNDIRVKVFDRTHSELLFSN
jgi:hypothetical protein